MASPRNALPPPLRKLRRSELGVATALKAALKRGRKAIRAEIVDVAAQEAAFTDARKREKLFGEIKRILNGLAEGMDANLQELTTAAGRAGHQAAVADLGNAAAITRYSPERNKRYFEYIRPGAGDHLAAVFTGSMADNTVRSLRTAFVETFRQGTVEGWTANEAHKHLRDKWNELAGDADTYRFTDKAGRSWEEARYLQMLIRTNAQRVSIDSYMDTCAENGFTLARISDDGDPDCPRCAAWEGRIISYVPDRRFPTYEDARAAGMFHPNCTHRPLWIDDDDPEVARQAKLRKPDADQMRDKAFMQRQKDAIDEAQYTAEGMSAEDARRAVTADRLERAIRSGTFSDEAAQAARMLTPAELDGIRANGIPEFDIRKKEDGDALTHHGQLLVPRDASAQDIINLLGLQGDGREPPEPDEPEPEPPVEPPPPFPDDPNNMRVIRPLGGSTGAELVEDAHGQQFVRKRGGAAGGDAAEHLRSEVAADLAYQHLGVRVPDCRLYDGENPVKLSKFVGDAKTLRDYLRDASPAERKAVIDAIAADFDIDALFGNRDVIGMDQDNILVDKDGKPWRIDNGASFGWRAQGARKSDFDQWPDDLWSMKTSSINKGVLDGASVVDTAIKATVRDLDAVIDMVPKRDRDTFKKRVDEFRQLGNRATDFWGTGYTDEYNERVLVHSLALSKEGFRESVPKTVTAGSFGNFRSAPRMPTAGTSAPGGMPGNWKEQIIAAAKTVNHHAKDSTPPNQITLDTAAALEPALKKLQKGGADGAQYWLDALTSIKKAAATPGTQLDAMIDASRDITLQGDAVRREPQEHVSLTAHAHDYIRRAGGDVSLVTEWQESQAGNSWNRQAILRKVIQERVRPAQADTWVNGDPVRREYYNTYVHKVENDKVFAKKATETFGAYDAAVQLALENSSFEHRDGDKHELLLIRTETKSVLSGYGITGKHKGTAVAFKRGSCESHSVFKPTVVNGTEVTMVRVPFPLVKGLYFFELNPGDDDGCFAGDNENEFTCDARGQATVYVGSVKDLNLTSYKDFDNIMAHK